MVRDTADQCLTKHVLTLLTPSRMLLLTIPCSGPLTYPDGDLCCDLCDIPSPLTAHPAGAPPYGVALRNMRALGPVAALWLECKVFVTRMRSEIQTNVICHLAQEQDSDKYQKQPP